MPCAPREDAYRADDALTLIDAQMSNALVFLVAAVDAQQIEETRQSAIDVERASLDLRLRHRPPVEIDRARLDLQARQLLVDAAAGDLNRGRCAATWRRSSGSGTASRTPATRSRSLESTRTCVELRRRGVGDEEFGGSCGRDGSPQGHARRTRPNQLTAG